MWVLMHFTALKNISVQRSAVESGYIYHCCISSEGTVVVQGATPFISHGTVTRAALRWSNFLSADRSLRPTRATA